MLNVPDSALRSNLRFTSKPPASIGFNPNMAR